MGAPTWKLGRDVVAAVASKLLTLTMPCWQKSLKRKFCTNTGRPNRPLFALNSFPAS